MAIVRKRKLPSWPYSLAGRPASMARRREAGRQMRSRLLGTELKNEG
jgi:hypothetical protein